MFKRVLKARQVLKIIAMQEGFETKHLSKSVQSNYAILK